MYAIELSVLDKGAVLSVIQSRHDRYPQFKAQAMARQYAKAHDLTVEPIAGGFWLMCDAHGRSLAQIAIRSNR